MKWHCIAGYIGKHGSVVATIDVDIPFAPCGKMHLEFTGKNAMEAFTYVVEDSTYVVEDSEQPTPCWNVVTQIWDVFLEDFGDSAFPKATCLMDVTNAMRANGFEVIEAINEPYR
jgi:hypothetical protein